MAPSRGTTRHHFRQKGLHRPLSVEHDMVYVLLVLVSVENLHMSLPPSSHGEVDPVERACCMHEVTGMPTSALAFFKTSPLRFREMRTMGGSGAPFPSSFSHGVTSRSPTGTHKI